MISAVASSITQSTGISQPKTGKALAANNAVNVNSPQNLSANTATSEIMDFTNMSTREINVLVKAGALGDSFPPVLCISPYDPNPNQTALAMQDNKMNYIEFTKNRLAEAKSRGDMMSVATEQKFLDVMMGLQGKRFPETSTVNTVA
jgi:hypothetical protein